MMSLRPRRVLPPDAGAYKVNLSATSGGPEAYRGHDATFNDHGHALVKRPQQIFHGVARLTLADNCRGIDLRGVVRGPYKKDRCAIPRAVETFSMTTTRSIRATVAILSKAPGNASRSEPAFRICAMEAVTTSTSSSLPFDTTGCSLAAGCWGMADMPNTLWWPTGM